MKMSHHSAADKKRAQQQTADNKMVMILMPNGKRKFVKAKEWHGSEGSGNKGR